VADFNGKKCDSCGNVVPKDQNTRKLTRFEGPKIQGEYHIDLCPDCAVVPPDVDLQPLKRRKRKAGATPVSAEPSPH
jgi:ribosomal protein S26